MQVTVFSCLLLTLILVIAGHPLAEEGRAEKKTQSEKTKAVAVVPVAVVKPPPLKTLWAAAQDLLLKNNAAKAAGALYLVHYYYPDDEKGESALWQTANMEKRSAQSAAKPDWDKVKELFRRYINYYPDSPKVAQAYLELGYTYQAMGFYRESRAYFKLFLDRYPNSPLMPQAMRGYRDFLLKEGRRGEAEKAFAEWQQSPNCEVRLVALMGVGRLKSRQGDYKGALESYQTVLTAAPTYALTEPQILRDAGIANLHLNNTAVGREELYHYLSLVGDSINRSEVLIELAESYFQAGEYRVARKLYSQIQLDEEANERALLISTLRQAQILDNPEFTAAEGQRHFDHNGPEWDKPYLAVLAKLGSEPVAQDARFSMFKRYQARGQIDKAYEVGSEFLKGTEPVAAETPQGKRVGEVLLGLVEGLIKQKKEQEVCNLYTSEYRHFKDYPSGRLHAMVGQAMESLHLYGPAAALYFLALRWPMDDLRGGICFYAGPGSI